MSGFSSCCRRPTGKALALCPSKLGLCQGAHLGHFLNMSSHHYRGHKSPTSRIADQGWGENVACCFLVLVTHWNKQCFKHLPRRSQDWSPSGHFFSLPSLTSRFQTNIYISIKISFHSFPLCTLSNSIFRLRSCSCRPQSGDISFDGINWSKVTDSLTNSEQTQKVRDSGFHNTVHLLSCH